MAELDAFMAGEDSEDDQRGWSDEDAEEEHSFEEELDLEDDDGEDEEEDYEMDSAESDFYQGSDVDMADAANESDGDKGVLSAEALFAKAEAAERERRKDLPIVKSETEKVTASYDLGHLSCYAPISVESSGSEKGYQVSEDWLFRNAQKHTQSLINELFGLPNKPDPDHSGLVARLPPMRTRLPREKPVPEEEKGLTRWQKFALRKGIRSKRKNREWLEWDEGEGKFKRKWGFNRANDELKEPIYEHKDGDDSREDPFSKIRQEKKKRVRQNRANQMENLDTMLKSNSHHTKLPGTVDLQSAMLASRKHISGANLSRQSRKFKVKKYGHLDNALNIAQQSTGSMGKFDELNKYESKPKLKRNVRDSVDYMHPHMVHDRMKHGRDKGASRVRNAERAKQKEILFQVFGKEQSDAFDRQKASQQMKQQIVYKHKRTKHRSGKKGR